MCTKIYYLALKTKKSWILLGVYYKYTNFASETKPQPQSCGNNKDNEQQRTVFLLLLLLLYLPKEVKQIIVRLNQHREI